MELVSLQQSIKIIYARKILVKYKKKQYCDAQWRNNHLNSFPWNTFLGVQIQITINDDKLPNINLTDYLVGEMQKSGVPAVFFFLIFTHHPLKMFPPGQRRPRAAGAPGRRIRERQKSTNQALLSVATLTAAKLQRRPVLQQN